jgi:hypothetical protein
MGHFEEVTSAVRVAVTELLGDFGGASCVALELSRRIGIDKTLSWRVLRLARSTDAYEAIAHIPGPSGFRILLEAFAKHGAGATDLDALRSAVDAFDSMVEQHVGDRSTLDLILSSAAPERMDGKQLEASRRQAYRGNSVTWGVQARARYVLNVVAPNHDQPDVADVADIAGYLGFRRLRPITGWPMLQLHSYGGGNPADIEPMVSVGDAEPPLLEEFSAGAVPEFEVVRDGDDVFYTLPEGPVGNAGVFSCAFGWLRRRIGPLHSENGDDTAENLCFCITPVELMQFDLLVHRDIPLLEAPHVSLRGEMPGPRSQPDQGDNSRELPLVERAVDLGTPPVVSSAHIPRYADPVARACAALDRPLAEFRGFRVVVRYPAIPTRLVLSFPLLRRE